MSFVHVVAVDVVVSDAFEDAYAADAEDVFLGEAVPVVAAVECAGDVAVPFAVVGDVRVEEVDGDFVAGDAVDGVLPCLDPDGTAFDGDGDFVGEEDHEVVDAPAGGDFDLVAVAVEFLVKVSGAVQEGDGDGGDAEVRAGLEGVSGQDAQAAGVCWDAGVEADFHGEVRDVPSLFSIHPKKVLRGIFICCEGEKVLKMQFCGIKAC